VIELGPDVLDAIRRHGEADYPEECCGVLLGRVEGARRRIAVAMPLANARTDERRRRFLVTAEDYRAVERDALARGLDLVGFYHSHPDHPASPSEYDREHALPWHSYVVLAVEAGRAGACTSWVLAADRNAFEPEELIVEEAT
jgi:proteasome lid subunit RPN8/RPN11